MPDFRNPECSVNYKFAGRFIREVDFKHKIRRRIRFEVDVGLADNPVGVLNIKAAIRFGASLVHAFAEATVPKITVILRKAFGGAFITMNSKDLGADTVYAWPSAEIGVMGAKPAVGIVNRRELAAAEDPESARDRLALAYAEEHLRAETAAAGGFVDEIVDPVDTRERLSWALFTLSGGRGV